MKQMLIAAALLTLTFSVHAQDDMQKKAATLGTTLGAAVGSERSVAGGRVREFERGAIFWSRKTGARFVGSGSLEKYNELGGASGKLGFPVGDEQTTKAGLRQTFEHGLITTGASGEPTVTYIPGVQFTEDSLTITDRDLITFTLGGDNALLLDPQTGPDVEISCSCTQPPSDTSQRLGFCTVKISKNRMKATCTNYDCKGSCGFATSEN